MRNYKDKEEDIKRREEERNKLMGLTMHSKTEEIEEGKSIHESPSQNKQIKENESF